MQARIGERDASPSSTYLKRVDSDEQQGYNAHSPNLGYYVVLKLDYCMCVKIGDDTVADTANPVWQKTSAQSAVVSVLCMVCFLNVPGIR